MHYSLKWSSKNLALRLSSSLRKQPTFRDAITGLPAKWSPRNERRNYKLMTHHYPDLGSASDWPKICFNQDRIILLSLASTNENLYPNLGSVTPSVWSFCASFSNVISQGDQWCVAKYLLFSHAKSSRVEHRCNEMLGNWKSGCYHSCMLNLIRYISLQVGEENYLLYLAVVNWLLVEVWQYLSLLLWHH